MTCTVHIFPLYKRVGRVRRVAEVYGRKDRKDGESYWQVRVRHLRRELTRLGCTEAETESELDAFRDAVRAELTRRAYMGENYQNRPDGAA